MSTSLCTKRRYLRKWQFRASLLNSPCYAQLQYLAELFVAVAALRRMCFLTKLKGWFMTPVKVQTSGISSTSRFSSSPDTAKPRTTKHGRGSTPLLLARVHGVATHQNTCRRACPCSLGAVHREKVQGALVELNRPTKRASLLSKNQKNTHFLTTKLFC